MWVAMGGTPGGRPLSICGHQHCAGCLKALASKSSDVVNCVECGTACSIKDVVAAVGDSSFLKVAEKAAHAFLKSDPQHELAPCCGRSCANGLLVRAHGYSQCLVSLLQRPPAIGHFVSWSGSQCVQDTI